MSQAELALWSVIGLAILGMGLELLRRTRSPLISLGGMALGVAAVVIGRLMVG